MLIVFGDAIRKFIMTGLTNKWQRMDDDEEMWGSKCTMLLIILYVGLGTPVEEEQTRDRNIIIS